MEICKTFTFDAAHRLDKLPPEHKCFRIHGHTYRVDVFVTGQLDHLGMVCDYAEIAEAWKPLNEILDHHYLNGVPGLEIPTTEILAHWIMRKLHDVRFNQRQELSSIGAVASEQCNYAYVNRIRVWESSSTHCEVVR